MTFLRLALLKSPAMIHAASGCLLIYPLSSSCSFGQSHASICLWWDINGRHEDGCKLPGQIEGAADNGEVF